MKVIYTSKSGAFMSSRLLNSRDMLIHGWITIPEDRLSKKHTACSVTQDGRQCRVEWEDKQVTNHKVHLYQPLVSLR
jgi:hypothetical protein